MENTINTLVDEKVGDKEKALSEKLGARLKQE